MRQSLIAIGAALLLCLMSDAASAGPDGGVKIAVLTDMSGPYADAAGRGSVVMAELAAEDFGGQLFDKPISIISADHQNRADVGSSIARQWLDVDKVDAIFDVPNSGVMLAVQEIVRGKSGLLFVSGGGSSTFTGSACSPYGFQWTYDTYALANGAGRELARQGQDTWFLVQVDYAFGEAAAADLRNVLSAAGGKVVGQVKTPLNTADFSSFLLQAQASGAKVVAFLNAGKDTTNSIKQANEFNLSAGGQRLFGMIFFEADARGIGLDNAKGLLTTSPFYWAQTPEAEAVSQRFTAKLGRPPTWIQSGVYSSVLHYLKATQAAGTLDRDAIAAKLRAISVDDAYVAGGTVRADGRMMHDMLLTQVKSPDEMKSSSRGDWDVFKVLSKIPAVEAAHPMDGSCPSTK